jgi:HK97 gp10 family phage protein
MDISIKIKNLAQLKAAFQKAPAIATREFGTAIEKTAFKIEGEAKRNAPVNKQSGGGNLRQSISSRMIGKASAVVQSKAKYSAYVDQGTKPHIIRVKNARVLANRRTEQFFGKIVHHPGTRKQPYFTDALKSGEKFINNELTQAIQNIFNSIR